MGTPARPDDIARELGIEFTVEKPAKSNMEVLRFTFEFPADVKSAEYAEAVAKVTQWSKRVRPWTFVVPDAKPIVAAEMTWGARWRVGVVNRATRKAMKAFWSEEANARRLALSQPTPEMGINVLDATPKKEKATKELREQLVRAVTVLAGPGDVRDLEPNVSQELQ